MPKVTNLTDRGIPLRGWRILPKGHKVVEPGTGLIQEELPDLVAYCDSAKRLADQGLLKIDGYVTKMTAVTKVPKPVEKEEMVIKPEDVGDLGALGFDEPKDGKSGSRKRKGQKRGK